MGEPKMPTKARIAISRGFLQSFEKLPRAQQKKVREFTEKFERDPTQPGINLERVHGARDENVRSVRVDHAYRAIILHPPRGDVYVCAWVDHHDEAYAWARNRVFEVNPRSGTVQLYSMEEVLQADVACEPESAAPGTASGAQACLFDDLDDKDLVLGGVPEPLLPAVRKVITDQDLDKLAPHLPEEVSELLYMLAAGYSLAEALEEMAHAAAVEPVDTEDFSAALSRPQSQRMFSFVDDAEQLRDMLDAPLEQWRIFLHPSQQKIVSADAFGPTLVLGGAGTGKTVCLIHRARHLVSEVFRADDDLVLVTTFTRNLAGDLEHSLKALCNEREFKRLEVNNIHSWAAQFLREHGVEPVIVANDQRRNAWRRVTEEHDALHLSASFYEDEWNQVVMGQDIAEQWGYLSAERTGRGVRLSRSQRVDAWKVLAGYKQWLAENGWLEWDGVLREARLLMEKQGIRLPYRAILVDETQDMSPQALRLLRAMVPEGPNDLFLVGDGRQRIYGYPVRMSHYGIQIRGRSKRLRLNYRTTDEIRGQAVSVLKGCWIDDLDGSEDEHRGFRSLRHGPQPEVVHHDSEAAEAAFVVATVKRWLSEVEPERICVAARRTFLLKERYGPLLGSANVAWYFLEQDAEDSRQSAGVRLATMHRMKGLEFQRVLLAGVQEGYVPFTGGDFGELDEVARDEWILRERCLFHVACTRARDELVITGHGEPGSFFET
jgi:mRNA-degrading endonuclease RelE of RelBE toxin-antitoxin system